MTAPTTGTRLSELTGLSPLTTTTICPDPLAAYERLREQWGGATVVPVELDPGVQAWLVTGYRDILHVVRVEDLFRRDPAHWAQMAAGGIPHDSPLGPMMADRPNAYFRDGTTHQRLRAPLVDGLASLSTSRTATVIQQTSDRLLDRVLPTGLADLVPHYAAQVPMLTVAGLFGLSPHLSERLQACLTALFGSREDSQAGSAELAAILTGTLAARREHPAGDLTTAFLHHPNFADDAEIVESMVLMMSAGWETTKTWIAQTLRLMLTDARFASRLRGGHLGIDDALHEVLWLDPPMANMPARYATTDLVLGGQHIAAGDPLILAFAAGNADPEARSDNEWDNLRNQAHLAFSAGQHACPAAQPARLIARTAISTALNRLHDLQLTIPEAEIGVIPSPWTRCPDRLPVSFTATTPRSSDAQEATR
ncbi:MAG TPA: cytochrome P450 [Pseudonocardiaceae bacterium]|jgi:cytochrome P450